MFRKTGVRLVGNFFDSRGPKLGAPVMVPRRIPPP